MPDLSKHRNSPGESFASLGSQCQGLLSALVTNIIGTLSASFMKRKSHLGTGKPQVFARALGPEESQTFNSGAKDLKFMEKNVSCLIDDEMKSSLVYLASSTLFLNELVVS